MATLNIKNVPDALYKRLQAQARRQHRSLAQEVIHLLSQAADHGQVRSILDLRGLGKEAWRRIDARAHVSRERRSWD
jgi:plasmid stability protein